MSQQQCVYFSALSRLVTPSRMFMIGELCILGFSLFQQIHKVNVLEGLHHLQFSFLFGYFFQKTILHHVLSEGFFISKKSPNFKDL